LVDETEAGFVADRALVESFAKASQFSSVLRGVGVADLADRIKQASAKGCPDVVLLLVGHGAAPPGSRLQSKGQPVATTKDPTFVSAWKQPVISAVAGKFFSEWISAPSLAETLRAASKAAMKADKHSLDYKLIIDSCFSGRWARDP